MPSIARAACSSPTGLAGSLNYVAGTNKYMLCNGTTWEDLVPTGGIVGTLTMPAAANCDWHTTSSGGFATYSTNDTDCGTQTVTGTASVPSGGKVPAVKFASLPAGDYQVHVITDFVVEWGGTWTSCVYTITDGTTTSGNTHIEDNNSDWGPAITTNLIGHFSYSSDQTNITFSVQGWLHDDPGGGGQCALYTNDWDNPIGFQIVVTNVSGAKGPQGSSLIDMIAANGMTVDPITISATNDKWPDYLICASTGTERQITLSGYSSSGNNNTVFYKSDDTHNYTFDASGNFSARNGVDANCGATAGDIGSICSEGRCGFMGGGGGGSGGGSGTPGGADTQLQFNNSGSFDGSADLVWDNTNSYLGINKASPAVALDVVGDINYTGTIVDVSDIRMKYDIQPIDSPLHKLTSLNGFSFKMKGDDKQQIEYGVSAQDVQKVFPELVRMVDPQHGTLGVNYSGLIAPMIESIKSQQATIETLRAQNEMLAERLDKLEKSLSSVQEE